ncbi:Lrp/AsnC family transcriptional regulator [Roseibium sp. SCP14]|uniref:Lrp/AsnC family transcriptional regulator n=1 Tax=Roseibium sp. SCP14 TaxID=3141375 RepID=UPI00333B5FB9
MSKDAMTDEIDEKILDELRRNSRIPFSTLAKLVGRSRTAVEARINRLRQSKRFLRYTIEEPEKETGDGVSAIILVAMEIRKRGDDLLEQFETMPQISSCLWVTGEFDFALFVKQLDNAELQKILERIYKLKGVRRTETLLTLHREF